MVWDEASWLTCRGRGWTGSRKGNMESDPPTEPSTREDSPACWGVQDDGLKAATVLLRAPEEEKHIRCEREGGD